RLDALKPEWCLTYSVADAIEIRKVTGGNVVVRHWPDGGINPKLSASDWMKKYNGVAAAGFFAEATNEDGTQIPWLCDPINGIIPNALPRGFLISAPATATGT